MVPKDMVDKLDKLLAQQGIPESTLSAIHILADELDGVPQTVWGDSTQRTSLQNRYKALLESFG